MRGMRDQLTSDKIADLLYSILSNNDKKYDETDECAECDHYSECYDRKSINLYRVVGQSEEVNKAQMIIAAPDLTVAVHIANNRLDKINSVDLVGTIAHDTTKGILLIG